MIQHGLALPVDFLVLLGEGLLRVQWPGHRILLRSRSHHLDSDHWRDSCLLSMLPWDTLKNIKLGVLSSLALWIHQRTPLTAHNKDPDPAGAGRSRSRSRHSPSWTCSYFRFASLDLTLETSWKRTRTATFLSFFDVFKFFFLLIPQHQACIVFFPLTSRVLRWRLFKAW